jgi:hypothetical protein
VSNAFTEAEGEALQIARRYMSQGLEGRPLRRALERHARLLAGADSEVAEALLDVSPIYARRTA